MNVHFIKERFYYYMFPKYKVYYSVLISQLIQFSIEIGNIIAPPPHNSPAVPLRSQDRSAMKPIVLW